MLINAFIISCILLTFMIFFSFYRAYRGPTPADRVIAINIIGTKTVVIIALVSYIYSMEFFLDVALVYALISFIAQVGIAKYLEKGALD
jgi:multicomponent Na+:H+ antiporter subunit F